MTIGCFPVVEDDSSKDELAESPMFDAPAVQADCLGNSQGVSLDESRSSTKAVIGSQSHVKDMAEEYDGKASNGKLSQPSRFLRTSRISQPEKPRPSPGWVGAGISVLKGIVAPSKGRAESSEEQDEGTLAKLESKVEELQGKLRTRGELLFMQEKAHEQERKDSDTKTADRIQKLKVAHDKEYRTLSAQHERELRRQKSGHERELAVRQSHQEDRLYEVEQEATSRIEAANCEVASVRQEAAENQRVCREYEQKLKLQDLTIGRLQSARFKTIEASQWAPLESADIDSKLNTIQMRVRKWSSDHAMVTSDQLLDPEGLTNVINALVARGSVLKPELLHECLLLNKSMRKPGKAAAVLLSTAVMHDIMQLIIADPFFAFLGQPEEHLLQWNQAASLFSLLGHIGTYDEAGAEGLRCQLLRLLDPPVKDNPEHEATLAKNIAEMSRRRAVNMLTMTIMDALLIMLTPEQHGKGFEALSAIIEEAAMLSWNLWTRKAVIKVPTWGQLHEMEANAMSYDATSEIFEPHTMHNMVLEDEPHALDGREIVMICSPPVMMLGNAEGEDYHKRKILKKAVVWMG